MSHGKRNWGEGRDKLYKSSGSINPDDADSGDEGPRDNREEYDEDKPRGSFTLEELKACDMYSQRLDNIDAPKKKWSVNFGYLGSQYQGLQMNPDVNTVEKHLEKALFLAGGIAESNYGNLHKVQWSRSARTDRGVHALMQCCTMMLRMPLDGRKEFMNSVNTFLPTDMKVHSLSRVTKNFNSKVHCSRRRYQYLLPTYMLEDKSVSVEALSAAMIQQGGIVDAGRVGGFAELGSDKFLGPEPLAAVRETLKLYRIDSTRLELFRDALKCYEGTQSYHNFTTGKHPTDANSRRYVVSFSCGEPFIDASTASEWVLLSVVGQSFLLNQIRKMVALATEVANGQAPLSLMKEALSSQKVLLRYFLVNVFSKCILFLRPVYFFFLIASNLRFLLIILLPV
jgi:tRNA pseudouridine(38-40) synthase